MARGLGSSASGKSCICEIKDISNWEIVGYTKGFKRGYIVFCNKCRKQWNTKAKYCEELKKSSNLK
jgi:hypothetical protein